MVIKCNNALVRSSKHLMVYSLTFAWTKIHKCIKKYSDKKKIHKNIEIVFISLSIQYHRMSRKKKLKRKNNNRILVLKCFSILHSIFRPKY